MDAIIWSKPGCKYCTAAKLLLKKSDATIEERIIGEGWTIEQLLQVVPNAKTVPQIFLDGDYVGGYNELNARLT